MIKEIYPMLSSRCLLAVAAVLVAASTAPTNMHLVQSAVHMIPAHHCGPILDVLAPCLSLPPRRLFWSLYHGS